MPAFCCRSLAAVEDLQYLYAIAECLKVACKERKTSDKINALKIIEPKVRLHVLFIGQSKKI